MGVKAGIQDRSESLSEDILLGCETTTIEGIQVIIPRDAQGRVRDGLQARGYRVLVLWSDGSRAEVLAVRPAQKGGG